MHKLGASNAWLQMRGVGSWLLDAAGKQTNKPPRKKKTFQRKDAMRAPQSRAFFKAPE